MASSFLSSPSAGVVSSFLSSPSAGVASSFLSSSLASASSFLSSSLASASSFLSSPSAGVVSSFLSSSAGVVVSVGAVVSPSLSLPSSAAKAVVAVPKARAAARARASSFLEFLISGFLLNCFCLCLGGKSTPGRRPRFRSQPMYIHDYTASFHVWLVHFE